MEPATGVSFLVMGSMAGDGNNDMNWPGFADNRGVRAGLYL